MTRTAVRRPESPAPPTDGGPAPLPQLVVTILLTLGPIVALAVGIPLLWGHVVHLRDIVMLVVLYAITGHGVTIGFHRMFTHRAFKANRALKIVLAVTGSMAIEGSLVSWVANHRRHHMFSDREGDPHSPHLHGPGLLGQLRGFAHAHVGWLFRADGTSAERFAPDLLRDRDAVMVSRLFPVLALGSLALPFFVGWAWSGTMSGALSALLWAGLVRMALLHHITWSVNSICHLFGTQPYSSNDRSRNFAALAVVSMGESWHNLHHAFPSSARHGVGRGQVDSSAAIIRLFEKAGWATKVRWPSPEQLAAARA